jgi:membrane protein implicated in regulation of membrane protease activity
MDGVATIITAALVGYGIYLGLETGFLFWTREPVGPTIEGTSPAIGETCEVVSDFEWRGECLKGFVRTRGENWSAVVGVDDRPPGVGTIVEVVAVSGLTLHVRVPTEAAR